MHAGPSREARDTGVLDFGGKWSIMRRSVFASMVLAALISAAATAQALGPGDPAPDFTLNDVNGVPYTLSDYRGKVVLLALIGYG